MILLRSSKVYKLIYCNKFTNKGLILFSDISCHDIQAVVIFDDSHIWCVKKFKDRWFVLDSLSDGPRPIPVRNIFSRMGVGWIIVWNKKEPDNLDESSINEDSTNIKQSIQTVSKRLSKRMSMKYDDNDGSLDESLVSFQNDKEHQSNRFAMLSIEE